MKRQFIWFSLNHPKLVISVFILVTLGFIAALPNITTDTDPVKMLDENNPAVVLYNEMKSDFQFNDVIVVGLKQKEGRSLFTAETLERIHQMTMEIAAIKPAPPSDGFWRSFLTKLQWLKKHDPQKVKRLIVKEDIISPSTVDDILLNAKGELSVRPLMMFPPKTETEAQNILKVIRANLILKGKLASDDGSLVGIFIPIEEGMKEYSYHVGGQIRDIVQKYLSSEEEFYLAGLPIAETTFGNEMFIQMAVYAPLAGLLIFLLMYLFFRNIRMTVGPMLLAIMTVLWSMGGLIYSGNTVHIMSSMIPIFLLPVALLDSIHIISHLHDKIGQYQSKKETIWVVMEGLFNPMLFTTLTTMVGFSSLSFSGIPPVEVFGLTIGCGVFAAWFLSMTFLPALMVLADFEKLKSQKPSENSRNQITVRIVGLFHRLSMDSSRLVILTCSGIFIASLIGITKIVVNDNPVRWFKADHEIRRADGIMNQELAGTYMTNLVIEMPESEKGEPSIETETDFDDLFSEPAEVRQVPDLRDFGIIAYVDQMQGFLLGIRNENGEPIIGAATSIVDILRKVGKTALNDPAIPLTRDKITQYLFLFESGDIKRGKDLWKYITLDYQKMQIWLQLKNGDNKTMDFIMAELDGFLRKNQSIRPVIRIPGEEDKQLVIKWTGLTYINNIWQDEMVKGMGFALLGSFMVVFFMMTFLFRSVLWGFISMLPLSLSIGFIYGFIGWVGKFYDMPIAVLSSLALGLSIDFAIHYNQSYREAFERTGKTSDAFREVFKEPARAIWRNVLVLAIGFLPLFFAQLVPYVTVGAFFFVIMIVSGVATLLLLPSVIFTLKDHLPGIKET